MTNALIGFLVFFAMCAAIECYLLLGVVQRLRTTFEQLLAAAVALLAQVPGRSASRTAAPGGIRPRTFWRRLAHPPSDLELDRWADDGGRQPADQPAPADTAPMALHIAGGLRVAPPAPRPLPAAEPDDVDIALARWGLRTTEGHTR